MRRMYELERVLVIPLEQRNLTGRKANSRGAISGVRKTFSASERVKSRRKKKAPKEAATAVGVRGGMTEP